MRSVAMSTHVSPARKRSTCACRLASLIAAWISPRCKPSPTSSFASCFARSFDCTKTMIGGLIPSSMSCLSASNFPRSCPQNTSLCVMVPDAELRSPTVSRMGCTMTERASASTVSGSVALKSARVTCGPSHAATAASTCSTNPISNSLSASSSTRNSTALRLHFLASMSSFSRRGVATRMSTLSISLFAVALVRRQCLSVVPRHNSLSILKDCCASSLVGDSSSARGPPAASSLERSLTTMGSRNASVLPEPVGATASSSCPPRRMGTAWRWIGVGSEKPASVSRCISVRPAPNLARTSAKDSSGAGHDTPPPCTRMRCCLRRTAAASSTADRGVPAPLSSPAPLVKSRPLPPCASSIDVAALAFLFVTPPLPPLAGSSLLPPPAIVAANMAIGLLPSASSRETSGNSF
mmetsp:Transcript_42481/g.68301  ORF Transcript_42481/g.68301 Transcript_42481/m.68301 type:complete len:410 (-) Transcript_42481:68-1297(-)